MKDSECIRFLQWALPQMRMRWVGFRKVRGQVCKRVQRRIRELCLADVADYREYLIDNREEWLILDSLCRITISRFYRDRGVFDHLHRETLPTLARMAIARGDPLLLCWCAGCASGEEVYTLKIIWDIYLKDKFPDLSIKIVATDADSHMIHRAGCGFYTATSIKEMSPELLKKSFTRSGDQYTVRAGFRKGIEFLEQDIRKELPSGQFHLIMCRNLVFTYFKENLQQKILMGISRHLISGGILVIGIHESLPSGNYNLKPCAQNCEIYRKG